MTKATEIQLTSFTPSALEQGRISAFISQLISTYLTHWDESQDSVFLGSKGLMTSVFAERFTPIEKNVDPSHFKVGINRSLDQIQFAQELLAIAKHKKENPDSTFALVAPEGCMLDQNYIGENIVTVFSQPLNNGQRRQMHMKLVGDGSSFPCVTEVEFTPLS